MKNLTLKDLLIQKVAALYDIEHVLVKALPKMAKAATDPDVKNGFLSHLEETKTHIKRLETIFKLLEAKPKKLKCEGIRGIVTDGEWSIEHLDKGTVLDVGIIRAAEYAEHYEMAGYIAAIDWAKTLGMTEVVELLKQTLEEEKTADDTLRKAGAMIDKLIK